MWIPQAWTQIWFRVHCCSVLLSILVEDASSSGGVRVLLQMAAAPFSQCHFDRAKELAYSMSISFMVHLAQCQDHESSTQLPLMESYFRDRGSRGSQQRAEFWHHRGQRLCPLSFEDLQAKSKRKAYHALRCMSFTLPDANTPESLRAMMKSL